MKYLRDYYVPIVAKNRDYLTGFLDASYAVSPFVEIDFLALDSMRYNDLLPNGQRRRHLSDQEILDVLGEYDLHRNIKEPSTSNKEIIIEDDVYLEVSCVCGNYRKFNTPKDIPWHNVHCEICNKILVEYTNLDCDDIEYDGPEDKMMIGLEGPEEFTEEDLINGVNWINGNLDISDYDRDFGIDTGHGSDEDFESESDEDLDK